MFDGPASKTIAQHESHPVQSNATQLRLHRITIGPRLLRLRNRPQN
jgi:hypothetical protein